MEGPLTSRCRDTSAQAESRPSGRWRSSMCGVLWIASRFRLRDCLGGSRDVLGRLWLASLAGSLLVVSPGPGWGDTSRTPDEARAQYRLDVARAEFRSCVELSSLIVLGTVDSLHGFGNRPIHPTVIGTRPRTRQPSRSRGGPVGLLDQLCGQRRLLRGHRHDQFGTSLALEAGHRVSSVPDEMRLRGTSKLIIGNLGSSKGSPDGTVPPVKSAGKTGHPMARGANISN